MKKTPLILLIILFFNMTFIVKSQNFFSKVYYDSQQNDIQSRSVVSAFDNGYIIVGSESSQNGIIFKVDSLGVLLWNKKISFSNSTIEFINIIKTIDSCYVLIGNYSNSINNRTSVLCIKIDLFGDTIWSKNLNSNNYNSVFAKSIQQTYDSCYIIAGYTDENIPPYNKIFLTKIDQNGSLQWVNILTGSNNSNIGNSVIQIPDSSFLVFGTMTSCSPCNASAFLININSSGEISWSKKYSVLSTSDCYGYDLINTDNGVLCYMNSGIIKIDYSGNFIWSSFFEPNTIYNCINCPSPKLRKTSDNSTLLINGDCFGSKIAKIDTTGLLLWISDVRLSAVDAVEASDKGLFIIGNGPMCGVKGQKVFGPKIGVIKTDFLGITPECLMASSAYPIIESIIIAADTFLLESGGFENTIHPIVNNLDIIENTGCVDVAGNNVEIENKISISITPNPTTKLVNINFEHDPQDMIITIYNINLQILSKRTLLTKNTEIDVSSWSNGLYFIKIQNDKTLELFKLIKE